MCFLNIKACQHILLHQKHKIMIFKKASYDPFKNLNYYFACLIHNFKLSGSPLGIFFSHIPWINSEGGCIDYLVNEGT